MKSMPKIWIEALCLEQSSDHLIDVFLSSFASPKPNQPNKKVMISTNVISYKYRGKRRKFNFEEVV